MPMPVDKEEKKKRKKKEERRRNNSYLRRKPAHKFALNTDKTKVLFG